MAARARRLRGSLDYWPGFVDALSTLILAIVFFLVVFMLGQFFVSQELSGKDDAIQRLNRQLSQLSDLLALERTSRRGADEQVASFSATLAQTEAERTRLQGLVEQNRAQAAEAGQRAGALGAQAANERDAAARAVAQVELLNNQISAMRRQLAALEEALGAAETRDREAQGRVADLGARLNVALAQRVQELARYRSDFFGRLRQVLGSRGDIRVVGDRFVFQSELFFAGGAAALTDEGRAELDKLAAAIADLDREIPPDIPWILRVDGHTDKRPLSGFGQFRTNWDLSAARAISVVQYLATRGVPPNRLMAAGLGEFQPLEAGDTEDAYRRNRRIELKLTDR